MPDISMCYDQDCPNREKCYRFMATPDKPYQSYFAISPRNQNECEYFIPHDSTNVTIEENEDQIHL
jgi:hypothetical protein